MQITSLEVRKIEKDNMSLKGVAVVTMDHCLRLKDIKIVDGPKGLFIAMPSKKFQDSKSGEEKYSDTFEMSFYLKDFLQEDILKEYNKQAGYSNSVNKNNDGPYKPDEVKRAKPKEAISVDEYNNKIAGDGEEISF